MTTLARMILDDTDRVTRVQHACVKQELANAIGDRSKLKREYNKILDQLDAATAKVQKLKEDFQPLVYDRELIVKKINKSHKRDLINAKAADDEYKKEHGINVGGDGFLKVKEEYDDQW